MASRDLDQTFSSEDHSAEESYAACCDTYLPSFPSESSIVKAIPEIATGAAGLGRAYFLPWVEFTLENPDEIWQTEDLRTRTVYQYLNFVSAERRVPAFAVEVAFNDDAMSINNYVLIVSQSDLEGLRSGSLAYSRSKEWEREKLVRNLNEKALLKYDEDRLDEARLLIDTAIRVSGNASAYLLNNRGLISWKMGRTDEAKRDFLESISLDEGNGDPYFNIGLIFFDESDYRMALRYLRRAVDLNPVDSQFLTELGHLYLEMEQEEEALQLFRQALESDPKDPQVDFHLGYYFLYKKGQPRHAVKHYHRGLEKEPSDQFALADLAVAHWILGNRRKTRSIYRLLKSNPCLMPYTMSRLVYLNLEMGDYETALKYYRTALSQRDPFEPEWLHYNAALVYAKTGRPQQALDTLDLAVRAGGEPVIKRVLAEKTWERLKRTPHFKRLIKAHSKRRNR